ncbi:MAG: hypothetical protein ISS25_00630 [Nanoarchaeota archaeon]|nr:hypothetical protein [DPANN group archaeon]MBL7116322.1 hypothetical protein [Nanoarchaeota archaeon]
MSFKLTIHDDKGRVSISQNIRGSLGIGKGYVIQLEYLIDKALIVSDYDVLDYQYRFQTTLAARKYFGLTYKDTFEANIFLLNESPIISLDYVLFKPGNDGRFYIPLKTRRLLSLDRHSSISLDSVMTEDPNINKELLNSCPVVLDHQNRVKFCDEYGKILRRLDWFTATVMKGGII